MPIDVKQIGERVQQEAKLIGSLRQGMHQVLVGQEQLVDRLIVALFCNNHVLLEGVPGLAKTLTITTFSKLLHASFQRIQFTPDLLPADLLGTLIYNPKTGEFTTKKGPVFANVILADEINRAPAKVQSALLEAMQERQVTIGDETFKLDDPFLVLATQNPIDQEGTYPLPEAQVDRFIFKVTVSYPTRDEEMQILNRMSSSRPDLDVDAVLSPEDVLRIRGLADEVFMDDKLKEYIVNIVTATRDPEQCGVPDLKKLIRFGASPRATIFLSMAAKAQALLEGRGYVTPQDIKLIAMDVLRHRVIITYEAEAEEMTSEAIVDQILQNVEVP